MKILIALCLCATTAMGQETLSYTSASLSGIVQLSQALAPSQANQVVTATSYSYSQNGLLQFSPGPQPYGLSNQKQSFVFSTDANGNITSWSSNVSASAAVDEAGYQVDFISSPAGDFFAYTTCTSQGCEADPVGQTAAGAWTVESITPVAPQPTDLQAQVTTLQSQVSSLTTQMSASNTQVTALTAALTTQTNATSTYHTAYAEEAASAASYKKAYTAEASAAASLTKKLAAADAEIAALRAELRKR